MLRVLLRRVLLLLGCQGWSQGWIQGWEEEVESDLALWFDHNFF